MSENRQERMAALLRRMGAMEGGVRQQHRQKMSELAKRISSSDDSEEYMGLTELCETLNMATEDVLIAIRPDEFVPGILSCLAKEYNVELMLLAARALTYLIDAIPPTSGIVCSAGGIPTLCDKLRNIVDIDVAEQALTALEKIAVENPLAVLGNDGLPALLGFIDFFSLSTQRKALTTVAHICRRVSPQNFASVRPVLPHLHNYIQHEDSKIAESSLLAILRVIHGVHADEDAVVAAFGDLSPIIIEILEKRALDAAFTNAIKILGVVIAFSPKVSESLLEFGLMFTIQGLLEGAKQGGDTPTRSPSMKPRDSGSPQLGSPLSPSTLGVHTGTPPSATRLSSSRLLSTEQTIEVVGMMSRLLPQAKADFMKHWTPLRAHFATVVSRQRSMMAHPEPSDAEEDEEEEIEELSDAEVKKCLAEMQAQGKVVFKQEPRHSQCRVGTHSCDFCGAAALAHGDWFRCNELPDFDTCGRCLVENGEGFCSENGRSFCDMALLQSQSSTSSATQANIAESIDCPRTELYKRAPHLQLRVCESIGTLVRLANESEHPSIRLHSLDFVSRVVTAIASPELRSLLVDVPLCDFLSTCFESGDGDLHTLAPLTYVCSVLLAKLPDPYTSLFLREGIVHHLSKLKRGVSLEPKEDALDLLCSSEEGWMKLLHLRASAILSQFQDAGSNRMTVALQDVATRFASKEDFRECCKAFANIYDGAEGISTFELVTSSILHEFVSALVRHPSKVKAVVDVFHSFSPRPASVVITPGAALEPNVPLLVRFVRQLQSVLSQYENFPPLASGGVKSVTSQIRLKISPEEADKACRADLQAASVNIEPLATIGAVADFILARLVPNARPKPSEADEPEDAVEDVLPEEESKARRAANQTNPPTEVFIRLGDQCLSHKLSMVQVMQRYVTSKPASPTRRTPKLPPGLPKELQDAFLAAASGTEVQLTYSLKPFGPPVKPAQQRDSELCINRGVTLDQDARTHGASTVERASTEKLLCEKSGSLPLIVHDTLLLLRVLSAASSSWASLSQQCLLASDEEKALQLSESVPVPAGEFINPKLNNKLLRQVTNPIFAGQLEESWCVRLMSDCPFLFPSTTRTFLFDISFHGTVRALSRIHERLQETGNVDHPSRSHRIQRLKLRVHRDKILESARRIDEVHGAARSIFEMEFYGEEGSGLGPTQEFYSLLGKELQQKSLHLWREEEGDVEADSNMHSTVHGLFPRPQSKADSNIVALFKFIGRLLARCVLDRRIIGLRFSRPFLKMLRGDTLVLEDVSMISPSLYDVLAAMVVGSSRASAAIQLNGKNVAVCDLALNFVLSGKEDIPLVAGGEDREVTAADMVEYVQRSVNTLLKTGVEAQANALREGFDELVPLDSLRLLEIEDLAIMFAGHEEKVTIEDLEAYTVQDHGFTASSPQIKMLFEVIAEMTLEEQRSFFQFLTGSPKLPVGGLASLRPKFTIVRKTTSSSGVAEGDQLPSAMTCQNFLKLPAYDTKDTLKRKLFTAINEGSCGFNFT